jgi:hypothetical protein
VHVSPEKMAILFQKEQYEHWFLLNHTLFL